ncbi:MAG: SGNH/GDSL hydrolase family protein [Jatrophihabitantaceae bacterium]
MAEARAEDGGFRYSNLSERPAGRLVSLAGLVIPGVAHVQRDVGPFADDWARANQDELQRTGPLWIALGDSLSQGIGASSYDRGWVGQLRERLARAGRPLRVVNLAVSGARTQDVLDVQIPALAELAAVRPPELVTLMIGSNDVMSRRHRDGLPVRMEQILRLLPRGAVVTTLPNPSAAEVNDVIARFARERGLVVAELRDPRTTSWRGKLAADHFHPNDKGYAALAEVIGDALPGV